MNSPGQILAKIALALYNHPYRYTDMPMMDALQDHLPKYVRLAQKLRQQIVAGELAVGAALPSFAQMRASGGISQDTLTKAHDLLEREGLIVRERGRGVFVAPPPGVPMGPASRVIAAMGPTDTLHPYWSELIGGAHDAAQAAGYSLLLLGANQTELPPCAGFINLGPHQLPFQGKSALPQLSVLSSHGSTPSVQLDDAASTQVLVRHLLELGHKRIAYLASSAQAQRISGWRSALKSIGVDPPQDWLYPLLPGPFNRELGFSGYGYQEMKNWLRKGFLNTGCTALLTHNDDTALGVLRALKEADIQVPEDLSVVGFDGLDWVRRLQPSLTSLEVPLREIGRCGVELLLETVAGNTPSIPAPFVGRLLKGGSTGPVPLQADRSNAILDQEDSHG